MNPELKTKWIADLRANPNLQARNELRTSDSTGFCCLGRLRIVAEFEWKVARDKSFTTPFGSCTGLDFVELETVELSEDEQDELMVKNDYGETFAQIADWIEANL